MKLEPKMSLVAVLAGALLALLATAGTPAFAADKVTYYEHVAPILQANCMSCHQPAGKNIGSLVAPMSLTTYEEARPWARAIARKVKAREMPPWFADDAEGRLLERARPHRQGNRDDRGVGRCRRARRRQVQGAATGCAQYRGGERRLFARQAGLDRQDAAAVLRERRRAGRPGDVPHEDCRGPAAAGCVRAGVGIPRRNLHGGEGHGSPHVRRRAAARVRGEPGRRCRRRGSGSLSMGCIAGGAEPTQLPEGFGMELKKGSTITFNMHYYKQAGAGHRAM